MTSDERREVAERLRKTRGIMAFVDALGIDPDGDWCWTDVSRRVADLIDPTCEVMEVPDNDEFMIRVVSGFMCKRCGHEAIVERNCDGSAEPPKYCPRCGARVVSGNVD